jgi:hypothetical protein
MHCKQWLSEDADLARLAKDELPAYVRLGGNVADVHAAKLRIDGWVKTRLVDTGVISWSDDSDASRSSSIDSDQDSSDGESGEQPPEYLWVVGSFLAPPPPNHHHSSSDPFIYVRQPNTSLKLTAPVVGYFTDQASAPARHCWQQSAEVRDLQTARGRVNYWSRWALRQQHTQGKVGRVRAGHGGLLRA